MNRPRSWIIKYAVGWVTVVGVPLVIGFLVLEKGADSTLKEPWVWITALLVLVVPLFVLNEIRIRHDRREAEQAAARARAEAEEKARADAEAHEQARRDAEADWADWRERFRQATPARDLNAGKVASLRDMSERFVHRARALRRPVTLPLDPDERGRILSHDAATYLRDQLVTRKRPGLILQGRHLLGKTHFLIEWLRREHPELYVLVPRTENGVPPPLPRRLPLPRRPREIP